MNNEPYWILPITAESKKGNLTKTCRLSNIGDTRPYGGAISAAAFLQHFVEKDVKWAHIDIAGPASNE